MMLNIKEIRFFGKIGFLSASKKKSDFLEKSDFSAHEKRNPIFWKNRISQCIKKEIRFFGKIGFLSASKKKSDFLEKSDFSVHQKRNPIFWKTII